MRTFWRDIIGKVGAPIFAATLVACLLSEKFLLSHGILMALGLGMMIFCHWSANQHDNDPPSGD
jgi:hypothetical protein